MGLALPEPFQARALHGKVELVDLLPHLRVDLFAHLPCILTRRGHAAHDGIGILLVEGQEMNQVIVRIDRLDRILLADETGDEAIAPPACCVGCLLRHQRQVNIDLARNVVGPFQIAAHPVEAVRHA